MIEVSLVSNPLGGAQARLLCTPTRHLQVALGYPVLVLVIAMMIFRASQPMSIVQLASGALPVLLVIQGALLAIVASSAIRRAVLRDCTTGMIDSHRLSAMSGGTLVLGYLTGPTAQAIVLAAENYVIGVMACAFMGNVPWLEWTVANAIIACAAFPIWSASLLLAVCTQGRASLGGLLFACGILGGVALVRVVPAFVLIAGPILLFFKLGAIAVGVTPPLAMLIGVPIQLALGVTFVLAAARKVRRADVQAFGPWLGLVLLAEAVLIGLAAVYLIDDLAQGSGFTVIGEMRRSVLLYSTLVTLAVISFVPIACAAQAAGRWERRRSLDPDYVDRPPVHYLLITGIAMLLFAPIVIDRVYFVVLTGAPLGVIGCLMIGVLTMAAFLRRAYATRDRVFFLGLSFFLVLWVAPVLVEFVWFVYQDVDVPVQSIWTPAMAFSPAGAAYALLTDSEALIWPGLSFQALLAMLLLTGRRALPPAAPVNSVPPPAS